MPTDPSVSLDAANPYESGTVVIPRSRAVSKSTAPYERRLHASRVAPTFMHYLPRWQLARYWSSPEGQRKKAHMKLSVTNPRLALEVYGHLLLPEKRGG